MSAIGQPDYQRGVVSAQKELYSGAISSPGLNVGIPPATETLVVISNASPSLVIPTVAGISSGVVYPALLLTPSTFTGGYWTFLYDVSAAVDPTVKLTGSPIHGCNVVVYADAGVHLTADASKLTNQQGLAYIISSLPNPGTADHPPNELQSASVIFNYPATTTLLAAPGAGKRYRLFCLSLFASSNWAAFGDSGGMSLTGVSSGGTTIWTPHPQGVACNTNAAVGVTSAGANPTSGIAVVQYTTETV